MKCNGKCEYCTWINICQQGIDSDTVIIPELIQKDTIEELQTK